MKGYNRLTKEHINDAEFCSGCSFDDDLNGCEIGGCDKYYMYFETYEKLRKLEDKIESGELGDVKELKQELKAHDGAANAYRIFFEEQKYWREVAERALSLICADVMSDIQTIVFPKTKKQVSDKQELYSHYIKLSKKELEDEKNERL